MLNDNKSSGKAPTSVDDQSLAHEPTMEEILASIRRIISEDGYVPPPLAPAVKDKPVTPAARFTQHNTPESLNRTPKEIHVPDATDFDIPTSEAGTEELPSKSEESLDNSGAEARKADKDKNADQTDLARIESFNISEEVDLSIELFVPDPPRGAVWLAAVFTPPVHREQFLGDLEECYRENVAIVGIKSAALSYWWHVLGAGLAFLVPRLLAMTGLGALIKRIGA